ncbi:MAG TPA: hypothetical protein PLJ35_14235 [Anaerolineae bacterium]|nr:hypothetical protein [Anaerolineae bacterium]HOQ99974.1 hypothetical protein [Anaerolineae bacterium]HPL29443.1 hypothetical protein [Anaerolineae bacterium]
MTKVSEVAQRYVLVLLVVAFLAGTAFGLVGLGWNVWPVEWTGNAGPADLDAHWQRSYLTMAAEAYMATGDAAAARERVNALTGPQLTEAQVAAELQTMIGERTAANDTGAVSRLQALATVLGTPPSSAPAPGTSTQPAVPRDTTSLLQRLLRVCGLVILVLVLLAGLLLLVYFLQARSTGGAAMGSAAGDDDQEDHEEPAIAPALAAASTPVVAPMPAPPRPVAPPAQAFRPEATALGPFVATYNLGDIDFDMSFGIESATGDFLGECGLGMAETVGGGDVQRVTAFEVWLFDKTDIRTVSVVLASSHAHSDAALRTKLASRGEIVLAQPGGSFSVKTSSLKLEGRILDLAYGSGDVPAQSYFTTFSVELAPVPLLAGQR